MSNSRKDDASSRWRSPAAGGRPAASYLVRFWLEPREEAGEAAPYRGYARDLQTGEESYFGDPGRLAEHILRRLRAERQERASGQATDEIESDENDAIETAAG